MRHQQLSRAPRSVLMVAAVSVLLFLFITVLWVHTHVQDTWAVYHIRQLPDEAAQIEIHGDAGGIWVVKYSDAGPNPQTLMRFWLWPAVLATGLLAFASTSVLLWPKVQRIRAEARMESGLCPSCGYDLRATPDCCPECGAGPQRTAGGAA